MRRTVDILFVSILVMLFLFALTVEAADCFTGSDLLRLRTAATPAISPDGGWIAYVVQEPPDTSMGERRGQADIWIVDVEGKRDPRRFAFGPSNEYSPKFSPDGRWIGFLSNRGGAVQVYKIGTDGGEAVPVTNLEGNVGFFAWSPDGGRLAVTAADPLPEDRKRAEEEGADERFIDHDDRFGRLWIVDAESGDGGIITPDSIHVQSAAWSPEGSRLAIITSKRPVNDEIYFHSRLEIIDSAGRERIFIEEGVAGPVSWSPDGESIAFMKLCEHPEVTVSVPVVAVADVESRTTKLLGLNHSVTIRSPEWLPGGKRLLVIEMDGVRRKLAYISVENEELDEVEEILGPYYGGANFDVSRDGSKVAMLKGEPNRPPDVWAKELGFLGKTRKLTDLNPWIDERDFGETRVVEWKSRDGTRIEGVLYLPAGYRDGTRYPAVISVHGGPQWAWWLGWHGTWHEWALALSCRGYVVLLPNPRGSLGYGVGFARANFDDFGGGDYEDIVSGADYLVSEGMADEKRLGICGWSYGGAMTAWSITQTKRFRAAVVGAGVTNLYSFHGTTDITPTFLSKFLRDVPYLRPEAYRNRSAVQFVKNADTPTLVLHGEEDARVPVGQAYEFYHGLVQTGCRADLVVYPREGHGFSEIRHQIDLVDRIVDWFELYLGE
jgi:dipeptidyl aminopeptidase/acylaminoacyl peptidase